MCEKLSMYENRNNYLIPYIKKNMIQKNLIDLENTEMIFDFDDTTVVFLFGESHGTSINSKLSWNLLKNLHKNKGVRLLLVELGYVDSLLINEYLETGNSDLLDRLLKSYKETYYCCSEIRQFWIKLYHFNMTFSKKERIKVIGIDVNSSLSKSMHKLTSFLTPSLLSHDEVGKYMDCILEINNAIKEGRDPKFDYTKVCLELVYNYDSYKHLFKELLNDKYFDFIMLYKSILAKIQMNLNALKSKEIRENTMYENFKMINEHYPDHKFFGVFGNAHVSNHFNIIDSFAHRLRKNECSPVKNKVLSINCLYNNSTMFYPKDRTNKILDLSMSSYYDSMFADLSDADINILYLDKEESPFLKHNMSRDLFLYDLNRDNTQVLLVLSNSKHCNRIV